MAAASASCAYSLVLRPSSSIQQFAVPFPSFASPRLMNCSFAFSFRTRKNRSIFPVLSMRQESKGAVSEVTAESWTASVLNSETPVLVEFYTSWCGPCQMVHRVVNELATDYAGKLKCVLVNVDQEPGVAKELDIKAVPIVLLFKNGEKCESVVGTMPKEFFVSAIERIMAHAPV